MTKYKYIIYYAVAVREKLKMKWKRIKISRMDDNQKKVRIWLDRNDRKPSFLAKQTGLSRTAVSMFLTGKYVTSNVLLQIARVIGIELDITVGKGNCKQTVRVGKIK